MIQKSISYSFGNLDEIIDRCSSDKRWNLNIHRLHMCFRGHNSHSIHVYPGASAYRLISAGETEPLPGEANADFYTLHKLMR